jgi:hypothetical protein
MRRRWQAWKRRQPSRVQYAWVPYGTRIVASGLVTTMRFVEVRTPAQF